MKLIKILVTIHFFLMPISLFASTTPTKTICPSQKNVMGDTELKAKTQCINYCDECYYSKHKPFCHLSKNHDEKTHQNIYQCTCHCSHQYN